MSRTDNTKPWPILMEERPELPWVWILNVQPSHRGHVHAMTYKRRERRRYWHGERQKAKRAMERGETPEPSRTRHDILWSML